jgi:hypothetical protein
MSVPTSYDYNTFAVYLHDEVLRQVAHEMFWDVEAGSDAVAGAAQVVTVNGATTDQEKSITVDALPAAIYAGNQITFTGHATTYIAALDMPLGTTELFVYPYADGVIPDNTVGSYVPFQPRKTHPVYRAITDEALLALGLTEISQVQGMKAVHQLRARARVEAWRAVLSNAVGDVDTYVEGNLMQREQVFAAAKEQLDYAEQEYQQLFGYAQQFEPQYTTSSRGTVRARW